MSTNLNIDSINTWINTDKKPLIISGPCSAESFDQLYATSKELRSIGIDIIRAGVWKPRTRPGMFEGVGAIGLNWLEKVKKENFTRYRQSRHFITSKIKRLIQKKLTIW